ncbi:MAG: restriction endonuclease subunit S, partial [Lachnospiraceae bacterium]|nr:restriction endonuclease subunit S [Lachnospiraceae bacterium]
MARWRKIRLGDVCVTNAVSYSPKEKWGFVNYLDTGNITDNKIDSIQYIDVKFEKLPSRARRKVKYNSIIYSTVRPNQRHFGIIKSQPENFLVSTGFVVIDVDERVLDADFLYYMLTQTTFVESLHAIAEQSTSAYPSIKASDIEDLEIGVPDVVTQRKIADILSSLDRKMKQNRMINDNLSCLLQALYQVYFGNISSAQGTLSDICAYSKDRVAVSELNVGNYFSTENILPGKVGTT